MRRNQFTVVRFNLIHYLDAITAGKKAVNRFFLTDKLLNLQFLKLKWLITIFTQHKMNSTSKASTSGPLLLTLISPKFQTERKPVISLVENAVCPSGTVRACAPDWRLFFGIGAKDF